MVDSDTCTKDVKICFLPKILFCVYFWKIDCSFSEIFCIQIWWFFFSIWRYGIEKIFFVWTIDQWVNQSGPLPLKFSSIDELPSIESSAPFSAELDSYVEIIWDDFEMKRWKAKRFIVDRFLDHFIGSPLFTRISPFLEKFIYLELGNSDVLKLFLQSREKNLCERNSMFCIEENCTFWIKIYFLE